MDALTCNQHLRILQLMAKGSATVVLEAKLEITGKRPEVFHFCLSSQLSVFLLKLPLFFFLLLFFASVFFKYNKQTDVPLQVQRGEYDYAF